MTALKNPRVQKLHDARSALDDAMVLLALHELGAYAALAEGPATYEDLAERLQAMPVRLRSFLELAVHLGLLQSQGALFSLFEGDEEVFDPKRPHGTGLPSTTLHQLFETKGRAVGVLRGDPFIETPAAGSESSAKHRANFLRYMDSVTQEAASELAALVPERAIHKIVDVGSGPGTYSHALLHRFKTAQALLIDRPNAEKEVLAIAHERGLSERVSFTGLDVTRDRIPGDQDLAILSNVIHCYGPETNQQLIQRLAESLAPNGLLIIKDSALLDDRSGPPGVLRFAVSMALFSQEGRVYPSAEVVQWCRAAGLSHIRVEALHEPADNYAVIATR
ncbi:MAG TPA: hypothetical protein DIU15_06635 [Deltaproteobacteria bacterium]|nr:hypothetical protein [Deltaproteobacteria bacterium]HCP45698.1 hypothetical protein [Deltaproteobacteria bacterium]